MPVSRYVRFEGIAEYEDRLDALIPRALSVIRIFERALSRRYDSPRRCELLAAFLLGDAARRVRIVVHEAAPLVRECPRLLELAQRHQPGLHIRQTLAPARHAHDPCMVVDHSHYLHRFHHAGMRAAQGLQDAVGARDLAGRHDELWEASREVRAGPPLGL